MRNPRAPLAAPGRRSSSFVIVLLSCAGVALFGLNRRPVGVLPLIALAGLIVLTYGLLVFRRRRIEEWQDHLVGEPCTTPRTCVVLRQLGEAGGGRPSAG